MPFNLSLIDLVSPYVVRGENLGVNHAALSVIRVTTFEVASAAFGTVIRGQCQFNGRTTSFRGSPWTGLDGTTNQMGNMRSSSMSLLLRGLVTVRPQI
jgi:hypothetical protein